MLFDAPLVLIHTVALARCSRVLTKNNNKFRDKIQSAVDAGALQIISPHPVSHKVANPRRAATHKLLRFRRNLPFDSDRRRLP